MHVRDLMTASPITISPEDSLEVAIETMVEHNVRGLPVIEDGALVGIVTDRDVKMALGPDARGMDIDAIDPRQLDGAVDWFMTRGVETIAVGASVREAIEVLLRLRVGALPVVDGPKLVGILSVTDVLRAAADRF
jgi:acetoin utilization protein AcuB